MILNVVVCTIWRAINEIVFSSTLKNMKEVEEKSMFLDLEMVIVQITGELFHLHIMALEPRPLD